ncbi:MAG: class I SAM-dependent methyltransferase [Eubacteriales bacterium]
MSEKSSENIGAEGQYTVLARHYDALNSDVDYAGWARFLRDVFTRFGSSNISADDGRTPGDGIHTVCDLACGTGRITSELCALGYDMTGIDLSEEMLGCARENLSQRFITDDMSDEETDAAIGRLPLLLCQDMRSFELYGTVDAVVCCLDSINYLDGRGALSCFDRVHNYLNPGGLFVFDVNSRYKFENIFAGHDYVLDADGVWCAWRNTYDESSRVCVFDLNFFIEGRGGRYEHRREIQREHMHTDRQLTSWLEKSGLRLLGRYSDFDFNTPGEKSERIFYVCECQK